MHDLPTHHSNLLDRIDAMPPEYAFIVIVAIIFILIFTSKSKPK